MEIEEALTIIKKAENKIKSQTKEIEELKAKLKEDEGNTKGILNLIYALESKHNHRAFMNENRFSKQLLPILGNLKSDIKKILTNKQEQ